MIARPASRTLAALASLALSLLLLACISLPWDVSQGTVAQAVPRWACPTPTPKPYGEAGPIKERRAQPTAIPSGPHEYENIYYTIWEQEYGNLGNPAPAPTPYTRSGSGFYLGQIVNLSPSIDVQADVAKTDVMSGSLRLFEAKLAWSNRGQPFPLAAARQVVISAIQRVDGARLSGDGWGWSLGAAKLAGRADDKTMLGAQVPTGDSEIIVPMLAPEGEAQTLDLQLDLAGQSGAVDSGGMRVQWSRASDPYCGHPGTWAASYNDAASPLQGPPPPANAIDVVAWAYTQIGRPYCWGGKGWAPCSGADPINGQVTPSCDAQGGQPCWDCSGLTWGAYKAVGVAIGHGTSNQSHYPLVWQVGSSVDPSTVAQPGDLLLFSSINTNGRAAHITHVGLYAGDGVMVHAADYPDGVIATPNVFHNSYYKTRLVVITRPPRT